ncbi:TetR/AcrR family transcriptional regulator C-terminal domain-containing protein [Intrasporangium sp. DVR]|uniref:TetR/AcrR family transcriptional regulator C-terminal domain-containing protein n=1 Tax=Intrasporangium sp. DVR TaxID=3127867 RepID=UPI00313A5DC2
MADMTTGTGEPSRTLALLWRNRDAGAPIEQRRRGPGRRASVDEVVDAAIALADADDLAAVTIRSVAGRVGVSTMSVYTYVPGKAELLDLMVDAVYLSMPRPAWRARTWRKRLERVAETNRALFEAHPWLTEVAVLSRPPLGPGLMAKYEHELAAFDGTGLDDVATDAALAYLLGFVQGHARAARDAARARSDTAMSDADWWAANQPVLERALDPAAYPRAVRVGAAAGEAHGTPWSPEHAWRFGLARTLDGLAALVQR